MNLKELLGKEYSELSAEEKTFLGQNTESMSADEKVKFEADVKEAGEETETKEVEDEALDTEAVKSLIADSVKESIDKKVDGITDGIVDKFMKGIKTQRKNAIDNGETKKEISKGEMETRDFMKALFNKDTGILKEHDGVRAKSLDTTLTGGKAGYLVPEELSNEVLRIAEKQFGLARRDMRYLPFSGPGNTRTIPSLASTISVTWTGEKVAKTSSQPVFGIVTQTLKKLAVIIPMSEEILEDSLIPLTQLLGELVAEAISKEEDMQFFNGTGSPWTGVLNTSGTGLVTMGTGLTAFTDITADNLLDMQTEMPSGADIGAKYYMHRSVFNVVRKLKDDNGNYIYQTPQGNVPATIWDKPYELSDAFPAVSATASDTPFVIYANLKVATVFGDKQQIRVKMLDQATITDTDGETTVNLAEQDMVALRFMERVGYVVALTTAIVRLKTAVTVSA